MTARERGREGEKERERKSEKTKESKVKNICNKRKGKKKQIAELERKTKEIRRGREKLKRS